MGNMQLNKSTNNISEIKEFAYDCEQLTNSLAGVMSKFKLKTQLSIFDVLKSKGLAISDIVSILVLLPFFGVASVHAMVKSGIKSLDLNGAKKDVYYDVKNNEFIDWRMLLLLHAKRLRYLLSKREGLLIEGVKALVFDDTPIQKTGKKTERVGIMHDHVSGGYILGYKLLVCGFWDGGSFIPLDFSFHREKGHRNDDLIKVFKKTKKALEKASLTVLRCNESVSKKKAKLNEFIAEYESNPIKTNNIKLGRATDSFNKIASKLVLCTQEKAEKVREFESAKKKLKQFYKDGKLFGLTNKERKEQYKKIVTKDSCGYTRRRELDKGKISVLLEMLNRAVKNGFVPDYVLVDSWFFCFEILDRLSKLKSGTIKLVSMVKINNQLFYDCRANKELNVKTILQRHLNDTKTCKSLKSKYIQIPCKYKGLRVNLFFVKMGRTANWHLLVTTNLNLKFIELMNVYQIRWSIEVFFKECKQYLNLGKCKSSCFDAQVADTTISMIQHIMLTYCKRINCQQSFGGLFKELSKEMVELDLVTRIIKIVWALIEIICEMSGIDFIDLQDGIMKNDKSTALFMKMIPERVLDKSA